MENNPKRSKAFIITFILILLLCLVGYYFYANRAKIFDAKGATSISKIFAPLLGSSKNNDLKVVTDGSSTNTKITGVVITDNNGNKIVRAEAGENLKKGDVLYISGFNKNNDPIVMKAISSDKNKSLVFGVAGEDIPKGSMGNIIIEGLLKGVATNRNEGTLWAVFNTLYLSDKNYGGMTKNPPVSPSYIVPVGSVVKVDAIDGQIQIGGFNIKSNLSNKDIANIKMFNSNILNYSEPVLRSYWNSVFGGGVYNNNGTGNTGNTDNTSSNGNNGTGSNWDNGMGSNWNNNGFELIPITLPDTNNSNFTGFNSNFPFVSATATPSNIKTGETSVISWTSSKTTSCNSGVGNSTKTEGAFTTAKLTKSRSYVVTCTGAEGTTSSTVYVNVIDEGITASPFIKITATSSVIKSGETTTITWTSDRATTCSINGDTVAKGKTGSFTTPKLTSSTSYSISCTGPGGTTSENIYITVTNGALNAQCSDGKDNNGNKLIDIEDPNCHVGGILTGDFMPTHYSETYPPFTNKTECNDGVDNNGNKKIDGEEANCHIGGVLTAKYDPTYNSESISPTLDPNSYPTIKVTASPNPVVSGTSSTITWTSTNTTSCNSGTGNSTKTSDSLDTGALTVGRSYSVTCTGANGSVGSSVFVGIKAENNIFPTVEISANPNPVISGNTTVLGWKSTNATSCNYGAGTSTKNPDSYVTPKLTSSKFFAVTCTGARGSASDSILVNVKAVTTTTDTTTGSDTSSSDTVSTPNSCLLIENNPLVFTEDEKARLSVLLRKFYLISSTLKTAEDLTTANSGIEQYKNFINQTEELTQQCYAEITPGMISSNSWIRHGNPWYTKTSGGSFPYTDQNTGYLNYSQLEGGMTPAGHKVISGYYYGTTSDGLSCDRYNTFEGYGQSNQINNKPQTYMGHYLGGAGVEANGSGYPGDSLLNYSSTGSPISGKWTYFYKYKNTTSLDERQPKKTILESGCSWKDGIILDNTERLLNIW